MISVNYYSEQKLENDLTDNLIQNFICRDSLRKFIQATYINRSSQWHDSEIYHEFWWIKRDILGIETEFEDQTVKVINTKNESLFN